MSSLTFMLSDAAAQERIDALLRRIRREFPALSEQLRRIAQHVEQHHRTLGQQGIREVAQQCGVHPSAVVRFAKRLGFGGYQDLREQFLTTVRPPRAGESGRGARLGLTRPIGSASPIGATDLVEAAVGASLQALERLRQDVRGPDLEAAAALMAAAPALWLLGSGPAFAIAASLNQGLQQGDTPVRLVDQLGGMQLGQLRGLRPGDLMIAVACQPCARETLEAARLALDRGARLIALSDDPFCPLTRMADVALIAPGGDVLGRRLPVGLLVLAQALALIGLAPAAPGVAPSPLLAFSL
ncbi:transcriptional regulator, RpiR family [Sphaerotilus natans]|uniref:MurR/RpiR family transcriptional regulator n=1 Tax=Sphaerotilus natans TaxID=34103 RepID=UPI00095408BB|nr:MurR/RpiR family transcriptional regulator [Sphaerotilus natans]SIS08937.1 transcriptional regulator, RpiR family [Sphaerotilus natans]